jgi:hypothetical protein
MIQFMYMNMRFNLQPKTNIESGVSTSKAENIVSKLKKWIEDNNVDIETLNTEESVKEIVISKYASAMRAMQVTADDVVSELKKLGFLSEIIPEKVKKIIQPIEHQEISLVKLAGLKLVDDEEILKQFEDNKKFIKELQKNIFDENHDIDTIYVKALTLESEKNLETSDDYFQFAEAGLIRGGRKEVEQDLEKLAQIQKEFKEESLEDTKKIATIVERALSYCVKNLNWYGSQIRIESTSRFDDVKRGIDGVLEIKSEDDRTSHMGLGVDVTYSGLQSHAYKTKVFKLLQSIQDGYGNSIKYFKDSSGHLKREFSVPKVILHFSIDDVTELVYLVKHSEDTEVCEQFKKSPKKIAVLNQILVQCELFELFAEKSRNPIAQNYSEVRSHILELASENPALMRVIDTSYDDATTKQIRALIADFQQ